ncbi:YdeI/OmpD-associated family protein [Flagellimonas allohymeniacidonis]|uniref:YdhG-like domain-containing protein n=1 Tax=Flagellimonas allohymeniacidonis TaxID=2517819 RepID=A0A4Q8QHY4_9FLAO|nr:DUF1801 domain-containing protein [Allomuricauda hymeniacidonis]TAI49417.1 hypothetical protein EW142_06355 [Allomuricauda hymeniacidonis]
MKTIEKVNAYFEKESPFKEGVQQLRKLALQTEAQEHYKWNFPVYTINEKNVFGICRFKGHFGVWFFNGVFLSDPKKVLENAQEGKTKAMRHWKFTDNAQIEEESMLAYLQEAIENQKKGMEVKPEKKGATTIPEPLKTELSNNQQLREAFGSLTSYKQKEYSEYIGEAKQETTKAKRLQKIVPLIEQGIGLNDAYRKKST